MKKIVFLVALSVILISGMSFAQEAEKEEMPMGMGKKYPPMMGTPQMVATDEGGVIVLAGPKLMKYDADLNLVKEVELKMPAGGPRGGSMGGKQCPMTGMADQGVAQAGEESQKKPI